MIERDYCFGVIALASAQEVKQVALVRYAQCGVSLCFHVSCCILSTPTSCSIVFVPEAEMGKKKKITAKIVTFYRGPKKPPTRIANENDMQVISDALIECIPKKNCTFEVHWKDEKIPLQLAVGFNSSLRCLRQKRTRAIIFDDTTPPYVSKYLTEFAKGPIIQAHGLDAIVKPYKLKKLMVVSLVKPNTFENPTVSEKLQELCLLLSNDPTETAISFHPSVTEKIPASGASGSKKAAKKKAKQLKRSQNKTTC